MIEAFVAPDNLPKDYNIENINPGDTTSQKNEKLHFDHTKKEVAGIKLEGSVHIPSIDTTKEYYFLSFSGNEKEKEKLGKMIKAIEELGYDVGNEEDLKKIFAERPSLAKELEYGMAIKNSSVENNKPGRRSAKVSYATFNPNGEINSYEEDAASSEDLGLNFDSYSVLVVKKKTTATAEDFLAAQKRVQEEKK